MVMANTGSALKYSNLVEVLTFLAKALQILLCQNEAQILELEATNIFLPAFLKPPVFTI